MGSLSAGISKLQGIEKAVISANALVRSTKENISCYVIGRLDYVPLAFSLGHSELSSCRATGFVLSLVTVWTCQILAVSLGTHSLSIFQLLMSHWSWGTQMKVQELLRPELPLL